MILYTYTYDNRAKRGEEIIKLKGATFLYFTEIKLANLKQSLKIKMCMVFIE